jgi:hypothetical protein
MTPNPTQIGEAHMKVMFLGLVLCLLLPIAIGGAGFLVRHFVQGGEPPAPESQSRIFFYALLFVAVSELPVALFLKKQMLKPLPTTGVPPENAPTTAYIISRYLVIFNLAAACSLYGFVWFFLGGTFGEFVLFAVIGLIIFRLVRPSREYFYSLFGVRPAIE